jgi:hypothetical protein
MGWLKKYQQGGYSTTGYKANSPDKDNPYNIIPSGRITMQNVPHPVLGIDNLGNRQMMRPGGEYQFQGDQVFEMPVMQQGGAKNNIKIPDTNQATFQDSLDVYNNSQALLNYYRNRNYTEGKPLKKSNDFTAFDQLESDNQQYKNTSNQARFYASQKGKREYGPVPYSVYHQDIDKNKFKQRESASGMLDTRAPMALYDKRINPDVVYSFENENKKDPLYIDSVTIYGYDPVMVKPYSLLTAEEKEIRKKEEIKKGEIPSYTPTIKQNGWYSNNVNVPMDVEDVSVLYNPDGTPKYTQEMKEGGIPERYKNMGFTRVGQKKAGDGQHKWKVLAKKGDSYKVVQGGYRGMQDFKQHHSEERRDRFWDRMGGKNSSKAKDPFSPLYWHKRFGTWEYGGPVPSSEMYKDGGMIKRADGSYSQRGLWDNIRANAGSGKKPTKEMLQQEKKIRAAEKKEYGGWLSKYK